MSIMESCLAWHLQMSCVPGKLRKMHATCRPPGSMCLRACKVVTSCDAAVLPPLCLQVSSLEHNSRQAPFASSNRFGSAGCAW